jgi:recombination protein RecA
MSYGSTRIGQGRDKARVFLEENPEMLEEIRRKVIVARGFGHLLDGVPAAPAVPANA